jgi:hypothetical protein
MSLRMPLRWSRAGAVALAVLVAAFAWLPAAAAAPSTVISLRPEAASLWLSAVENDGLMDPADPDAVPGFTPVAVEWGGTAELQLPPAVDGSAMVVSLMLAPTEEDEVSRTYSTEDVAPDDLVVTDLGSQRYSVQLPADDTVNGPVGWLVFDELASGADVTVFPLMYQLEFTGTGVLAQQLTTQPLVMPYTACGGWLGGGLCEPYEVEPGSVLELQVPADSMLRTLDVGSFQTVSARLISYDEEEGYLEDDIVALSDAAIASTAALGEPLPDLPGAVAETFAELEGEPGVALTQAGGQVTSPAPYTAQVTLPTDLAVGQYSLVIIEGRTSADPVSVTYLGIEVPAPASNAGLFSHTGWTDEAPGGASPLVPLGIGLVLTAGAVGLAAHRSGHGAAAAD